MTGGGRQERAEAVTIERVRDGDGRLLPEVLVTASAGNGATVERRFQTKGEAFGYVQRVMLHWSEAE